VIDRGRDLAPRRTADILARMWWRRSKLVSEKGEDNPRPLREALRRARIEAAERTSVVVDLRDAEIARLELLDDGLDSLFADIPADIELFDRGIARGDTPRLWIDAVAHVHMGRDKRVYRFVQDSRFGRQVIAESSEAAEIVAAVTDYVARRLLEREHALSGRPASVVMPVRRARGRGVLTFLFGVVVGIGLVIAAAWMSLHAGP
jgi:hypothetical protein